MRSEHRPAHPFGQSGEPGLLPFLLAEYADDPHGRDDAEHALAQHVVAPGDFDAEPFEPALDEEQGSANDRRARQHEKEQPPVEPRQERTEYEQAEHRRKDRQHRLDGFRQEPTVSRDHLHQPRAVVLQEEIVVDIQNARGKRVVDIAADAAVDPAHQGGVAGLHQALDDDQQKNGDADRGDLGAGRIGSCG